MSYCDLLLKDGCKAAALVEIENGVVWAQTEGLEVQESEGIEAGKLLKALGDEFDRDSATRKAMANGIRVGGKSYVFVKSHERSMYGKSGRGGIIISATDKVMLIGTFSEDDWPHGPAQAVGKLADYLESLGY